MNAVTQPQVCYIHMAMPHALHSVCCTALTVRSPSLKKKFASSLTGDINPQSSHWNNRKMKIAHNSAYVQMEAVNFTFALQAVIVYFFVPTSKKSLCRTLNIKLCNAHYRWVQSLSHTMTDPYHSLLFCLRIDRNFTFTWQAIIVHFYNYSNHRRGYCQPYNLTLHNS